MAESGNSTAGNDYDFYSPYVAAALVLKDGTRVPFFTNVTAGSPTDAGKKAKELAKLVSMPFLESLQVELDLSTLPKITATLTPPFRDAQAFLDSPLMEYGQTTLEVMFGYSSGASKSVLSEVFSGLLQPPGVQIGMDYIITLNAIGVAGHSMVIQEGTKSFSNRSRYSIINEVVKGPDKNNPRKIDINTDFVTAGSEADTKLIGDKVTVSQNAMTDWMFIWQLVRECGCWMVMVGGELRILERNLILSQKPKYTFRLFDYVDGKVGPINGDFPILSATCPEAALWLPGSTDAMVVNRGIDSKTGAPIAQFLKPSQGGKATGGGDTGPKASPATPMADPENGSGGRIHAGDPNSKNLKDQMSAQYDAETFNIGIKMDIESIGIPDLIPGDVVAVRGVGKRYDWNYGVFNVTHSIGGNGYMTRVSLFSNTASVLQDNIKAQVAVNSEKADEPKSGTKVEATKAQ